MEQVEGMNWASGVLSGLVVGFAVLLIVILSGCLEKPDPFKFEEVEGEALIYPLCDSITPFEFICPGYTFDVGEVDVAYITDLSTRSDTFYANGALIQGAYLSLFNRLQVDGLNPVDYCEGSIQSQGLLSISGLVNTDDEVDGYWIFFERVNDIPAGLNCESY